MEIVSNPIFRNQNPNSNSSTNHETQFENFANRRVDFLNPISSFILLTGSIPENITSSIINMQQIFNAIQNKLCNQCMLRFHHSPPDFSLNMKLPESFLEEVKFLEFLNSLLYCKVGDIIKSIRALNSGTAYKIEEIENLYDESYNYKEPNSKKETFFSKILESFKARVQKEELKKIRKVQIKYKLKAINEQIEMAIKNYKMAIENERFEDSEHFKRIYYELFGYRIGLEEKLIRLENPSNL